MSRARQGQFDRLMLVFSVENNTVDIWRLFIRPGETKAESTPTRSATFVHFSRMAVVQVVWKSGEGTRVTMFRSIVISSLFFFSCPVCRVSYYFYFATRWRRPRDINYGTHLQAVVFVVLDQSYRGWWRARCVAQRRWPVRSLFSRGESTARLFFNIFRWMLKSRRFPRRARLGRKTIEGGK